MPVIGPPRALPDRVMTLDRKFLERFPGAKGASNRAREAAEECMAWMEQRVNGQQMVVSFWYDLDNVTECMAALDELSGMLGAWDRAQP